MSSPNHLPSPIESNESELGMDRVCQTASGNHAASSRIETFLPSVVKDGWTGLFILFGVFWINWVENSGIVRRHYAVRYTLNLDFILLGISIQVTMLVSESTYIIIRKVVALSS